MFHSNQQLDKLRQSVLELELVNHELQASNKAVEKSTVAHIGLLQDLHHQLCTPVSSILQIAEQVANSGLTNEQIQCMNLLKSSGDQLMETLNLVGRLTELSDNTQPVVSEKLSIRSLVAQVIESMRSKAKEKEIILEYEIEGSVPDTYLGDHEGVEEMLSNLILQGLSDISGGKIVIKISQEKTLFKDVYLKYCVQYISTNPHSSGQNPEISKSLSGMILAKWVEKMQGTHGTNSIRKDDSAHTTEFWCVIPMERITDNAPEPYAIQGAQLNPDFVDGTKILIAEDNEVNQLILARNLKKLGFEVDVAFNGKEAVDLAKHKRYDIILMDINMPIMDGVRATQIIRNELGYQIPIITITANTFESDRKRYLEAGMTDYLRKPFRKDDLLRMVSKYLL